MPKCTLELAAGTRIEFWGKSIAKVEENFAFRISQEGNTLWAVPQFSDHLEYFSYHHREACTVDIEWNLDTTEITWAYSYVPRTVAETGITLWEFGEKIKLRTGADIDAWCASDPERPKLHFSPVKNWMNDPNGLCKVDETWHMFYQFHPDGTDWGPMHWGHATSKDLFHWRHMPVFLHPEQNLWRLGATGGAFSGTAFRDPNGSLKFYYTERLPAYDLFSGYREVQKIAEADHDLIKAERITTILEERPAGVLHDFRDPKVWWDDTAGAYRMVLGSSLNGDPAVLLYGSSDGLAWNYLHPLYRAPSQFAANGARAVECPDFFSLGEHWVLVMGFVGYTETETGRHNLLYALVGDFVNDQFIPSSDDLQLLDFGTDFYAMQSFEADGRQLAMAWMFNWETRKPQGSPFSGEMALPRHLTLNTNGQLCLNPPVELETAFAAKSVPINDDGSIIISDKPFELRLDGPLNNSSITVTQAGALSFKISVENEIISVVLPDDDGSIRYIADVSEVQDLRIFHDCGIIEIIAARGAICGTRRNYKNVAPDRIMVNTGATTQFSEGI